MSWDSFISFARRHPVIAYDNELKDRFKSIGRRALRELKEVLEETGVANNCTIDYNAGGIAVAGDFHLRGDFPESGSFDLFFTLDGSLNQICYRRTESKKDYHGENNNFMPFDLDLEDVVNRIQLLRNRSRALQEKSVSLPSGKRP